MIRLALPLSMFALLAACGGGGGGSSSTPVTGLTVRMASDAAAPLRYRGVAVVTATGTGLSGVALTFSGNGCEWAAAPAGFVDSDTVRHRQCTLVAAGLQQVSVTLDGGGTTTTGFEVPQPEVTMTVTSNGATVGDLVFTLDPAKAPLTVDNFLRYVGEGFYDGTAFHRHVPGFVMQGGGYAAPLGSATLPAQKATHDPIALEVGRGLSNLRYTVAMARTAVLDSATSQFFVNVVDNTFLDTSGGGYAVFGSITAGASVMDAMRAAPCVATAWLSAGECLPSPNLVVAQARQTR